jgi:hypothetical protein
VSGPCHSRTSRGLDTQRQNDPIRLPIHVVIVLDVWRDWHPLAGPAGCRSIGRSRLCVLAFVECCCPSPVDNAGASESPTALHDGT